MIILIRTLLLGIVAGIGIATEPLSTRCAATLRPLHRWDGRLAGAERSRRVLP